jgi:hypothetical protein
MGGVQGQEYSRRVVTEENVRRFVTLLSHQEMAAVQPHN